MAGRNQSTFWQHGMTSTAVPPTVGIAIQPPATTNTITGDRAGWGRTARHNYARQDVMPSSEILIRATMFLPKLVSPARTNKPRPLAAPVSQDAMQAGPRWNMREYLPAKGFLSCLDSLPGPAPLVIT